MPNRSWARLTRRELNCFHAGITDRGSEVPVSIDDGCWEELRKPAGTGQGWVKLLA
jgi:hypothetical protein